MMYWFELIEKYPERINIIGLCARITELIKA